MPDFEFTATAECDRCGKYLSSSDATCCCESLQRCKYRFLHISDEDRIETVWAINPIRAWKVLGDQLGREPENILPWRLQHRGMSLDYRQMGYDVTDADELRTPQ